ncbi:MAG TPA: PilZ domain-containing protein [Acidobacteriota bacterium]|nr:PilZ domain-containing protein [Acidobacteriota bacterium]
MNRRSRTRFRTDLTVSVTCSDLPDSSVKARLANLSVHGLSLIMGKKLHVGSLAKVEWGTVTFMGEVVYCKPHGNEVIVGLKVDDPVYETAKRYASQ